MLHPPAFVCVGGPILSRGGNNEMTLGVQNQILIISRKKKPSFNLDKRLVEDHFRTVDER